MILFSISERFLCDREPGLDKAFFPNKTVSPYTWPAKPRSKRYVAALNFSEKEDFLRLSSKHTPADFISSSCVARSSASDDGLTRFSRPLGSCNPARSLSRVRSVFFADKKVSPDPETKPIEANAGIALLLFLRVGDGTSSFITSEMPLFC